MVPGRSFRIDKYSVRADEVEPAINGSEIDDVDYEHRAFVNLAAAASVLALAFVLIWTIQVFDSQLQTERCLRSGRNDCIKIFKPVAGPIKLPVRSGH